MAFNPIRIWAPLVPYITIACGLFILHKAWVSILSYHLGMGIVLLLFGNRAHFAQIDPSGNLKILIVMVVLGGMGGLLLFLFWPLLGIPSDIDQNLHDLGLTAATWPYFIGYFILINPWLEELYWRGYLDQGDKRITLNDVLFSGYHILVMVGVVSLMWIIIVFVILSLGAWFWRQINHLSQGLSTSIASHLAADAGIILTIYFLTLPRG